MNLNLAIEIVGGLSSPSKMPCHGFSIPAEECKTGQKLRHVDGSICSKCYALKGRYMFGVVKNALRKRFNNLNHPLWCDAIAFLINAKERSGFFRWFDSGDVQSVEHLRKIVTVCHMTQGIQHWLPTREYRFVREYIEHTDHFHLT
jgi:hypothetical protein